MLDRLKPAWRMYQCQQKMEGISSAEILAIIDFDEEIIHKSNNAFAKGTWSVGVFVLLFLMTCCQGG